MEKEELMRRAIAVTAALDTNNLLDDSFAEEEK